MPAHNYKEELSELIGRALSDGASDIHLAAGHYPVFRISGNMLRNSLLLSLKNDFFLIRKLIFHMNFLAKAVSAEMHFIKKVL
jgi:Tfp pilus assembly pilus retraction ATPase PilT